MTKPTQLQMFYAEHKKIADANNLFLEFVLDGMTREDLQACIDRRPALWERFSNWLPVLPSKQQEDV